MSFKSGFVSIAGRPNVGKSTLLNNIAGEKIAIVSPRPQTTRNSLKAIITTEDYQVVFIDNPGIHKPRTKLGQYMVNSANASNIGVEVIIFMVEAFEEKINQENTEILKELKRYDCPVILTINKIDQLPKENLLALIDLYNKVHDFYGIFPISALKGDGVRELLDEIIKLLPEGPVYFPDGQITDSHERFIASEMIREQILKLISDEIPHGVGVEISSFKENNEKKIISIEADIYCEKEGHKKIIIGKNGAMLKRIGTEARSQIEAMLGSKVFLKLWVKEKKGWRDNKTMLKNLGYFEDK